jgi:hypothetical protein
MLPKETLFTQQFRIRVTNSMPNKRISLYIPQNKKLQKEQNKEIGGRRVIL